MSKVSEWIKSHKPHAAVLAVVAVAVICFAVTAACGAFSSAEPQNERGAARLTINVTADAGWDKESTPAIAHIEGNGVDFYHAVNPDAEGNKGTSTVELTEGEYAVSLIVPLNYDGSAYELYETSGEQHVSVKADGELSIDFVMKRIAAEDVTDEMVQAIVSQTKLAIKGGDETLKGDAGRSVLERLEQNAAANPNASDETKDEAAKAEEEVDVDSEPVATTPAATSDSNNGAGDAASGGGSASGGSSGSGGSGGGQASAHTHSWKDHTATRQVWVENWVTVPDYETQTIYGGRLYTQNGDGSWTANGATYWFYTDADREAFKNLLRDMIKNEGYIGNYQNVTKTEQVQVGSHQEDQGWYETETYVDYQYCDCGARK